MTVRFRREVTQTVQRFVACMADLAGRAVVSEAELVLRRAGGPRGPNALATSHGAHAGRRRDGHGGKRAASELEALSARFVAFVDANPRLRIEQINQQLGTTTADLVLPIRKLVARGAIKTEGRNRATLYFMAGAPPAEPHARNGLEPHPAAASGTDTPRLTPPT